MTGYSLSTSWNYSLHTRAADLIDQISLAGFDTVELNFALARQTVDEIVLMAESGRIKVSSIHNMCPLPDEISPDEASPDYYSLASRDEAERSLAVSAAKNTIDYASRLKAKAVVLHCGRVPFKDRTRELAAAISDKSLSSIIRSEMIAERDAKKAGCLDSLIRSLADLVPCALENGISLGLENRFYFREMPSFDEFKAIFREFPSHPVYYWHDTGHAEVFERLGLVRHKDLLDAFSNRLLGIHLHDIIGPINDHRAPGSGTFDFGILKSYIRNDTLRVIEAHQPSTVEEIRASVRYLNDIFGKEPE